MSIHHVTVLVDLDNVVEGRMRTRLDAERAIDDVTARLGPAVAAMYPEATRATFRLYGTMRLLGSRPRSVAEHLLRSVAQSPVRRGPPQHLIIRLETTPYIWGGQVPQLETLLMPRTTRCCAKPGYEQKLVDTYIAVDAGLVALEIAQYLDEALIVASTDIDMAPGVLQASYLGALDANWSHTRLGWLRRPGYSGAHDRALRSVVRLGSWKNVS
jgi:hypothetical protein